MTTVLLIIQILVAVCMTVVILLQQSEGGALGIGGGGGGGGGLMSGRGAANVLSRTTMILAAIFVGNSILMAIVTGVNSDGTSVFDRTVDTPLLLEETDEDAGLVPTDG